MPVISSRRYKTMKDDRYKLFYKEVESYFDLLKEECESGNEYFTKVDLEGFRRLSHHAMDSNTYQRKMEIEGFLRRTMPVLERITREKNTSILDAGCGIGTHSCFFSHFGANIIGVDISRNINIAKKQKEYLRSSGYSRGEVDFLLENIFSHLAATGTEYDIIWSNEAISHIDPPLEFLKLAYASLKPNGQIVISDHNNLNPLIWLSLLRKRGRHLYTQKMDPKTGEKISYALERCFSVKGISKLLRSAGFDIDKVIFHSFIPAFLRKTALSSALSILEDIARRMPLVRHLCGSYTIVGRK